MITITAIFTIAIFASVMTLGALLTSSTLMSSQPAQARVNDCSEGDTFCFRGGEGSRGGGGGGQGSIDTDSGDHEFKGGSKEFGGGHIAGNAVTGEITKCVGKQNSEFC